MRPFYYATLATAVVVSAVGIYTVYAAKDRARPMGNPFVRTVTDTVVNGSVVNAKNRFRAAGYEPGVIADPVDAGARGAP